MKSNKIDMTDGKIFPLMIRFSVPLILSSVLQLLFNAADVIVVGRFAGDNALAAVGSTSALVNLLVNVFLGLSIGCNVTAASFFGGGKKEDVSRTVHTTVLVSLFSGVAITVIGVIFSRPLLVLMGSPEDVLPLSTLYLKIFFAGITASVIYNFGSALLRAKGDTKRPLYILSIAGIINVVLNLIFVIVFHLSVAGVAWATVLSQCFSAFCVVYLLINEDDEFRLDYKKLKLHKDILLRIIRIGIPAGVQGAIFSLSNVVIQSTVNSFGSVCIAGNSACQSIEGFIYISMNGISQGSLTFVSQNMGAQKIDRIKKAVFINLLSVITVGLVLGNLAISCSDFLFNIYTKNPEVKAAAVSRLLIIGTSYFTCGIMDVMANSIRGMGYSFMPMIETLLGACGIRLLYLYILYGHEKFQQFQTYRNIFISYPVSWVITFAALFIGFVFIIRKKR